MSDRLKSFLALCFVSLVLGWIVVWLSIGTLDALVWLGAFNDNANLLFWRN